MAKYRSWGGRRDGEVLQANNMSTPRLVGDFIPGFSLHGGVCQGDSVIWGCRVGRGRMGGTSSPCISPPKTPVGGGGLMLISFPDRIMRVV